jgi:hypothetical protein
MSKRNAANVFTSIENLAELYPILAKRSNETLPFVTIQGFEGIAAGTRKVAKASVINYNPILQTQDDIKAWNAYSVANSQWIAEGRQYLNASTSDQGPATQEFLPFVYTIDLSARPPKPIPVTGPGPYAPVWQMSPVPPKLDVINFDPRSMGNGKGAIASLMKTKQPHLSPPVEDTGSFAISFTGPMSVLEYPVFDNIVSDPNRRVVATLSTHLLWELFFDNVLPNGESNDGIIIVTQSCDIMNTFRVDGSKATFMGKGDLHNAAYNAMKITEDFGEVTSVAAFPCAHFLNIYPSEQLYARYKTSKPTQYSITVSMIFVFAALVFVAYDYFVTTRQSRTEEKASKSNAIVQDMFPGDVAARLLKDQEKSSGLSALQSSGFGKVDRTAIAELHPEATVLCKFYRMHQSLDCCTITTN